MLVFLVKITKEMAELADFLLLSALKIVMKVDNSILVL